MFCCVFIIIRCNRLFVCPLIRQDDHSTVSRKKNLNDGFNHSSIYRIYGTHWIDVSGEKKKPNRVREKKYDD